MEAASRAAVDLASPDRSKFDTSTEPSDPKFAVFDRWLKDNGAVFPSVALREYAGNCRGVLALEHIPAQSTIISIPLKCLITDLMGRTQCEAGRLVFAKQMQCQLSMPNIIAVVLYILETRHSPDSFFKPYYDVLPSDWSDFPVFWPDEQLESWLQGSSLISDVRERLVTIREDYNEICRVVDGFAEKYPFKSFLEVRTAVGSRNFGIVVDGEKRTSMIPLADMLNHFRPRETSWSFDNVKRSFVINSLNNLVPGQQVLDSYGRKDNSRFLLHYGFAVENNREDDGRCQNELCFSLAIPPPASNEDFTENSEKDQSGHADPLAPVKRALLGAERASRRLKISMNRDDRSTVESLSFARIVAATDEELQLLLARTSLVHSSASKFISARNEAGALEIIAKAMNDCLGRYARSYEENVALLKSNVLPSFSPQRSALIVLIGEQQVARFWITTYETLKDILLLPSTLNILRALAELANGTPEELDLMRYATWIAGCLQPGVDVDD